MQTPPTATPICTQGEPCWVTGTVSSEVTGTVNVTGSVNVTLCTVGVPCYVHVALPEVNEVQGATILGALLVYCLVVLFVKASMRVVLTLLALFAIAVDLLTQQDTALYLFIIGAFVLGVGSNFQLLASRLGGAKDD